MLAGENTVESIQLTSFEEAVAAYASVQATYGEDHPLLKSSAKTPGLDASLRDEIFRPDGSERHVFDGDNAIIIKQSLEETAQPGSLSPYRPAARLMLDMLLGSGRPVVGSEPEVQATEPAGATLPEAPVPPRPLEQAPRSINGEIVEGHVVLDSFGQLITALNSAQDFAEDSQQGIVHRIQSKIEEVDPFNTEPTVYWGAEAQIIYASLVKAATRGINPHDLLAAYMLEKTDDDPTDASSSHEAQRSLPIAA